MAASPRVCVRGYWLYGEWDWGEGPELLFAENVTEAAHTLVRRKPGLARRADRQRWIRRHNVTGVEIHPYMRVGERKASRRHFWATSWEEAVKANPGLEVASSTHYDCLVSIDARTLWFAADCLWSNSNMIRVAAFLIGKKIRRRPGSAPLGESISFTLAQRQALAAAIHLATVDKRFGVAVSRGTGTRERVRGKDRGKDVADTAYFRHGKDVPKEVIDAMLAAGATDVIDPWPERLRDAIKDFSNAYGEHDLTWRQQKALWEGGREGLAAENRRRLMYGD